MNASAAVEELNRRITLYKPALSEDGQGGVAVGDPVEAGKVWAKFLKPRFWDGASGAGPATAITQGIVIRRLAGVTEDWTIQYHDVAYSVIHIDDSDPAFLTLTCQVVRNHW